MSEVYSLVGYLRNVGILLLIGCSLFVAGSYSVHQVTETVMHGLPFAKLSDVEYREAMIHNGNMIAIMLGVGSALCIGVGVFALIEAVIYRMFQLPSEEV